MWNQNRFLCLLLVVFTMAAYQPAWNGKPVWDDTAHFTNPGLYSLDGLRRIWAQPGATQQYYPLVHSVFWMEHKFWEYRPMGYHFTNILLHLCSALLLLKILRRLDVPGAWLTTALFALHPLQVESVAWISELKNTLSGVCYLGAALIYLKFDRERKPVFYCVALGLFLLGLMSKTVIATLPAALLVVFWWKRGRLSWKQDMTPLIPFFGSGLAAGLFTAWMERKLIGAEGSEFAFSMIERALISGRAFWFYLGKLFWPENLIFIYPRWHVSQAVWWQYLFPVAALLLLGVLWLVRQRCRGPLAGLLFFSGTLFPALGFLNVYPFRYSFVADHFQYLAGIGPIALAAAGITQTLSLFEKRFPSLKPMLCGALMTVLLALTWRQCGMYRDNETLWRTTAAKNPGSWMAHDNLGNALSDVGKVDEAIMEHHKALKLRPDSAEVSSDLANALLLNGQIDEAIANYKKSLEINPRNQATHYNLGNVLLHKTGHLDDAIFHLEQCVAIERSLKRPENVYAHYDLGVALYKKDRIEEAVVHYEKALRIQPQLVAAQSNLAWILATSPLASVRNGARAVELALQANRLAGDRAPAILRTLAAAYAEAGRFPEAIETAQKALEIAILQSDAGLAGALEAQLALYQAGKPFHEMPRP